VNSKAKVYSVNISEEKGTIKTPVDKIMLSDKGIKNDAHSGVWHRQVSLLAKERVDDFSKETNKTIQSGEFAENITTLGIDLMKVKLLDRFKIGNTLLEVTQIGKSCHGSNCAIFREVGKCVMPKEGIFTRVIKGGAIKKDDRISHLPKTIKVKVITLSDRASAGDYEDLSGPMIMDILKKYFQGRSWNISFEKVLIFDNRLLLKKELMKTLKENIDILFTTGGTGIGSRDITPDVIRPMMTRELPGIMDFVRLKYGENNPGALLSRSIAGTINKTLFFTLPGSVKAVKEYTEEIVKILEHSIFMIHDISQH
jgi:molybdopterin adenylyltransferase